MTLEQIILYVVVFLYGIVIGSFLNVCIYRIPKGENLVTAGSHCMKCGHRLHWYDLFPLFSWLFLRGRCRYCGERVSAQYPLIEGINGLLYILIFAVNGMCADSIFYSLMASVLLVIALIDYRTMKIPVGAEVVLLLIGALHLFFHMDNWIYYVTGFFFVGLFLLLCALLFRMVTGKGGLGLGDIELMACAGLCLGWGHGLFAIVIGSVFGAVVEGIRMVRSGKRGKFPFAPYLAIGILAAVLWGDSLFAWYLGLI